MLPLPKSNWAAINYCIDRKLMNVIHELGKQRRCCAKIDGRRERGGNNIHCYLIHIIITHDMEYLVVAQRLAESAQ